MSEKEKGNVEEVRVELNEHHHLSYLGQQINQINGQMDMLNKNVRAFGFLHKDLDTMNTHLYWIALSFKISIISGAIAALLFFIFIVLA